MVMVMPSEDYNNPVCLAKCLDIVLNSGMISVPTGRPAQCVQLYELPQGGGIGQIVFQPNVLGRYESITGGVLIEHRDMSRSIIE